MLGEKCNTEGLNENEVETLPVHKICTASLTRLFFSWRTVVKGSSTQTPSVSVKLWHCKVSNKQTAMYSYINTTC